MIDPTVSVKMITYNHAPFIRQAIEGVLRQKTSFPIELVIGEDCSTDGTREIVFEYQRKYPDIIRVITSDKNVGARPNSLRAEKACRGTYVAFCEGDDYWTDPYKLQKQVDFLENNPDYALVHSEYAILAQASGPLREARRLKRAVPSGFIYEQQLIDNLVATLTVVVRAPVLYDAVKDLDLLHKNWRMGDYPLWLEIARHYKIHYIDESLAVYNHLEESASHTGDGRKRFLFNKDTFDVKFYFINKYGASGSTIERIKREYYQMISRTAFDLDDRAIIDEGERLCGDAPISHTARCCRLGLEHPRMRLAVKVWLRLLVLVNEARARCSARYKAGRGEVNDVRDRCMGEES